MITLCVPFAEEQVRIRLILAGRFLQPNERLSMSRFHLPNKIIEIQGCQK